ncbi:uncharacterized protein L201_000330 [Kwoniella dendrophila CBS 6074]|uniref:Protein CPL1-like domain-containing protein n=1 Tax=Kwoniella dendrophila CBS 6074 TaxID=1295534 RepID=A0AAX4JJ50_9TREE
MVALQSVFTHLISCLVLITSVYGRGLFEPQQNGLDKRQNAADATLCATVNLSLLGINLASGVCICVDGGVITPASLTQINTIVRANQGILAPVLNSVGGVAGATTTIASNILPTVIRSGTTCTYPDNAVPNSCGSCSYTCYTDNTVTYVQCGNFCVLQGTACVSGIPQTQNQRRSVYKDATRSICPRNKEVCEISFGSSRKSSLFECINTQTDLESCGGCMIPAKGKLAGQDCTSIPNISAVSCQSGQCVVESCEKGYTLVNGECVVKPGHNRVLSGYWAALADVEKKIAIKK